VNRDDQMQFIESQIKPLWSRWDPTEAEVRVWMQELAAFGYDEARRAIQAYFAQQTVPEHRPLPGRFLAKARTLSQPSQGNRSRRHNDPTTDTFLECLEPPQGKPHLAGVRKAVYVWPVSKQSDPDYVSACAEHMRTEFDRLYGGHWIIVRSVGSAGSILRNASPGSV
jgi:hypothetical protein